METKPDSMPIQLHTHLQVKRRKSRSSRSKGGLPMKSILVRVFCLCLTATLPVFAQQSAPASNDSQSSAQQSTVPEQSSPDSSRQQPDTSTQTPTYRVTVIERTTQAVDYRDRGG